MVETIENGVAIGVNRAFKHTDTPDQEIITAQVCLAVMGEICEAWDFEDEVIE